MARVLVGVQLRTFADLGDEFRQLNPLRAAAILVGLLTLRALQASMLRLQVLTTPVAADSRRGVRDWTDLQAGGRPALGAHPPQRR